MVRGQVTAPDNRGDIFRAEAMLPDYNYMGVIDQLSLLEPSALTPVEDEQAAWLRCVGMSRLNAAEAVRLAADFLERYGASPLRFKALMLAGDCLLENDPAKALEYYRNVAENALTAEQRAELAYHKGYALLRLNNFDEAAVCFEKAATNARWHSRCNFYLGYIAYAGGQYERAQKLLSRTDRSEMPGRMADYYLAQIYYADGDYSKALATTKALNHSNAPAEFVAETARVAGESMFQLGDTKGAVKELQRYVTLTDTPARSALYVLGVAEFQAGHPSQAIDYLQKVAEGDDSMAQSAYLYIGQALLARGDRDAAILALDKALRMDYDSEVQEAAYYNYAVARSAGANVPFGSSAAVFEEFLEKFPSGKYSAEVQEYLVDGYINTGDYVGALASVGKMKNPGKEALDAKQKALYAIGARLLAAGDADRAIASLRQAQAMQGRSKAVDAQVALALGEALARKGQHGEAIKQFNNYLSSASSNDPNRDIAVYDIGYSYFALADYANAAKNFSKISGVKNGPVQSADLQADIKNRIADSRLYLGQYAEAAALYQQAYDTKPQSGDYPLYQIAVIQGYGRKHKEKIATLERLIDKFPSSSLVPDALLGITESQIQLGDNNGAIATYRRLVAEYPTTEQGRRGYLQMALTMLNGGRRAEAIEAYKDVVTLYPSSDEARMALEELKRIYADDGALPQLASWLKTVDGAPQLDIAQADRLTFEAAEKVWLAEGNGERLRLYLAEFPNGSYRPRALACLIEEAQGSGAHSRVVEYASEIVERHPDSPQAEHALYSKASAEQALGDAAAALDSWTALEQRASSGHMLNAARAGIMRTAADSGRVIAAADALLASTAIGAELRAEAEYFKANALYDEGRGADAVAAWSKLAGNTDSEIGAGSSYRLAQYYFDSGDITRAKTQVGDLINSGTSQSYWLARGFILLSDIYAAEGKNFEAREYLKSLSENYPGTEEDIFQMINERLE